MTLRDAIDTYHSLLTPDVARTSWEQMQDQTKRRGLYFGTRDIATVLRPRFLTTEQYHFLQDAIRAVMPAFGKAYRAALADELLFGKLANGGHVTVDLEKDGKIRLDFAEENSEAVV